MPDRERPLAPRGERAAAAIGGWLARSGLEPDQVLTSPAVRASETARLAADAGSWKTAPTVEERLYGSRAHALLDLVRELPDEASRPMLVGHEPTSSLLAALLIGGGSLRFPTACIASVRFDLASWSDVVPGGGQLDLLLRPKLLHRVDGD